MMMDLQSSVQKMIVKYTKTNSLVFVNASYILNENWESQTSLLVFPGGRDLPYVEKLSGKGTTKIRNYISNGGKYLGICAEAYFASNYIEFEKGKVDEVVGVRPLKLFSGNAIGSVSPNYSYILDSSTTIDIESDGNSRKWKWNINGGPYFQNIHHDESVLYIIVNPT
jgi:biotin---protein ligase